jgi:hypothetical protein
VWICHRKFPREWLGAIASKAERRHESLPDNTGHFVSVEMKIHEPFFL